MRYLSWTEIRENAVISVQNDRTHMWVDESITYDNLFFVDLQYQPVTEFDVTFIGDCKLKKAEYRQII